MPIRTTATFNYPLTTYAQGIAQDRLAAYRLANLLCPIVQVAAASGTYKKFDDRNAFLVEDTNRGIGGPRKRLSFEATDGTYNCQPHGLEIGLDDFERDLTGPANEVNPELLAQGKIKALISRKATAYAKRVSDTVIAALTAVTSRGNWSNPDIDPIDQIDEQLDALSAVVGTTENINLVLTITEWRALRGNAKIKARLGLSPSLALTRQQLVDGLLFPVNFEVSPVLITATKFGQTTATKTRLGVGYCIITHSVPNPTPFDPSAFKCFSTSSVLVDGVRTYREEQSNSEIHAVDWSEDIETTGSSCARLLAIT